jgi:hypothetical protein
MLIKSISVSGGIHFRKAGVRDAEARLSPLSPSAEAYAAVKMRGPGESYSDVILRLARAQ